MLTPVQPDERSGEKGEHEAEARQSRLADMEGGKEGRDACLCDAPPENSNDLAI